MKKILIFLLLFCSSLAAQNDSCPSKLKYREVSEKEFSERSDSLRRSIDEFWKEKEHWRKQGIMIDNFDVQSIRFQQFCATSNSLDYLYLVIDGMTKNKEMKVLLEGSLDSFEYITDSGISQKRIEFVIDIMVYYGISESRIEVFDALASRPVALPNENGNPENRRVEINVIQ